ncbi:hypothetical protein K466DRAFT_8981 [Polyporus arcularius HHB13444]|uniref:Uncharacterized protein n=1 Tax=Polyporus arcularius HHB13444 TaxID=1314778 RepID=A0A5C3NRH7_9APHY|nr:hypothetical protein K466DRAFT_8981 [Polyporus arcularius HHB13444]
MSAPDALCSYRNTSVIRELRPGPVVVHRVLFLFPFQFPLPFPILPCCSLHVPCPDSSSTRTQWRCMSESNARPGPSLCATDRPTGGVPAAAQRVRSRRLGDMEVWDTDDTHGRVTTDTDDLEASRACAAMYRPRRPSPSYDAEAQFEVRSRVNCSRVADVFRVPSPGQSGLYYCTSTLELACGRSSYTDTTVFAHREDRDAVRACEWLQRRCCVLFQSGPGMRRRAGAAHSRDVQSRRSVGMERIRLLARVESARRVV